MANKSPLEPLIDDEDQMSKGEGKYFIPSENLWSISEDKIKGQVQQFIGSGRVSGSIGLDVLFQDKMKNDQEL